MPAMTDLARSVALGPRGERPRTLPTLAAGSLGGLALGIAARLWMRLIADDPEFTWNGTLFIVAGFMLFGLTQSIAAVARRRPRSRRWTLPVVRLVGCVGMLPLFVAAGAVMLPTVVGGGLASARVEWTRPMRAMCVAVAVGPVLFVGHDLADTFGWSLHTLAGFVAMLAVYGTIIRAARFTFAAEVGGWRPSRRATMAVCLVVGLLLVVAVIGGGIK
jgi:hypothetical protein